MGRFLEAQKRDQIAFKEISKYFSMGAKQPGEYRGREHRFCLPRTHTRENLFAPIREPACAYFKDKSIRWHDGKGADPSNHLCSSQVCAVNFLFPFATAPAELLALIKPVFPETYIMLPIEDERFVAFEWIGAKNYLNERVRPGAKRTRGANSTSADAAVCFQTVTGEVHVVLIEWKYTESYSGTPLRFAKSGTDRLEIYREQLKAADGPIATERLKNLDALFYEPFYQFMRQQLLAHAMEKARELEASSVSVLHISPGANTDFESVTSEALTNFGDTAVQVWPRLLRIPTRFRSVHAEDLFAPFRVAAPQALNEWWDYVSQRYAWVAK